MRALRSGQHRCMSTVHALPTGYLRNAWYVAEISSKVDRTPRLAGKTLGMYFGQPSTRTRISFGVAMVQQGDDSFLIAQGKVLKWSPAGYSEAETAPVEAKLLTPPSTLRAFGAGYAPALPQSAGSPKYPAA